MRSGCDQPGIRHTTGRFPPSEGGINEDRRPLVPGQCTLALNSSAAVVSGGLGFNSPIAVFVFLFLFGFCAFLFLFWSWVLGSNPVQCASWCFVFAVFLIVFLAASLSSRGAPEQQTGQTRCGCLWWSWVQLPDRCCCVLVLVWFLRVSLFVLVLGLGFKSCPVRFVVFCVCGIFNFFWRLRGRPGVHPRST